MRLHKIERGRYVIYIREDWGSSAIRFEISRKYNFGLGWNVEREERDLQLSVYCFKLFSFWLTFTLPRLAYRYDPVETGFVWQSGEHVVTIKLLSQRGMDSSKPAVVDVYWDYHDWLFGRRIYSESRHNATIDTGRSRDKPYIISLPEGDYELTLDFYTSYWHRPRSPFVRSLERVEIKPKEPVPIPGKGENSWDIDDDAIHSCTEPRRGRTPEQVAADFREHILAARERYASRSWTPESSREAA